MYSESYFTTFTILFCQDIVKFRQKSSIYGQMSLLGFSRLNYITLRISYCPKLRLLYNSKNLQPLDVLACNSANKPSFQNLTGHNFQRLQIFAILASFLWANLKFFFRPANYPVLMNNRQSSVMFCNLLSIDILICDLQRLLWSCFS